jgi:CBS domain
MMARTGLDTMLRHLGAAYYGSLHGRAARSDVARALDVVEAYLDERPSGPVTGPRRVEDVMTIPVASVSPNTSAREIARLLDRYRTLPVLERWKVSQITYIASLILFGLGGLTLLASLFGLTLGQKQEITHEAIPAEGPKFPTA